VQLIQPLRDLRQPRLVPLPNEAHDAGKGFCRVDIHRVLVQWNLL
jgi:hypothetical protein